MLAEDWGGKENGMALVDCCQKHEDGSSISSINPRAVSVRYEIADGENIISVDVSDVRSFGQTPAETMQKICEEWPAAKALSPEKQNHLFSRIRLAWAFADENPLTNELQSPRLLCVQARLHAMSVLVYTNQSSSHTNQQAASNLYPGFVEEAVDLLKKADAKYLDIKSAALRTITSMVHLNISEHRLSQVIDATGLAEYHGYLPMLIRSCIAYQIENGNDPDINDAGSPFPQAYRALERIKMVFWSK